VRTWTGLIWFRIGSSDRLFKETLHYVVVLVVAVVVVEGVIIIIVIIIIDDNKGSPRRLTKIQKRKG
jgi:hypothetical protein